MRVMVRARLRRVLFAFIASVGALLLLEGAARLAILARLNLFLPPDVAAWVTSNQVVFDPDLGWRPANGFPVVEGGFFKGGAFDAGSAARRPGELRGFAFGDSQTHGAGLAEADAWPSVAERDLRAEGLDIEVINLGSSGYRSAQVLRLIESWVLPNNPDFLIVDCQLNDSEALPRDYGRSWALEREVLFQSRLYRLIWLGVATARGQNTGPVGTVSIEQPRTELQGSGNHEAIAELARTAGIPLIFVDYPFSGYPIKSLAPADHLPRGATVVPATAALRATGKQTTQLFLENNHLSVAGSEVVGKVVAETVRTKLGI